MLNNLADSELNDFMKLVSYTSSAVQLRTRGKLHVP